jgi:hypothetical protein
MILASGSARIIKLNLVYRRIQTRSDGYRVMPFVLTAKLDS